MQLDFGPISVEIQFLLSFFQYLGGSARNPAKRTLFPTTKRSESSEYTAAVRDTSPSPRE